MYYLSVYARYFMLLFADCEVNLQIPITNAILLKILKELPEKVKVYNNKDK